MANYLIIGGDGKEYGPVTDADVRQWIAEGRLAASSQAKAESDSEFRALAQFPEFASALQLPPSAIAPLKSAAGNVLENARSTALQEVRSPATSLKGIAILGFTLSLYGLIRLFFFKDIVEQEISRTLTQYPQFQDASIQKMMHLIYGPIGIGTNIFAMIMAAIIFWGAQQMQKLENFELSFIAAVLAMLPCATNCCAWVFGLPIGIWALIVLNKKGVKSQFK